MLTIKLLPTRLCAYSPFHLPSILFYACVFLFGVGSLRELATTIGGHQQAPGWREKKLGELLPQEHPASVLWFWLHLHPPTTCCCQRPPSLLHLLVLASGAVTLPKEASPWMPPHSLWVPLTLTTLLQILHVQSLIWVCRALTEAPLAHLQITILSSSLHCWSSKPGVFRDELSTSASAFSHIVSNST